VIAVRVGRYSFTAVAALKDPEIIHVHVSVRIKACIRAERVRLRNSSAQRARAKMLEVGGINVAVVVEITGDDSRTSLFG